MNNNYNPWNANGYNYPQYPYGMNQQMMQMPTNQNIPRNNGISGRVISNPNEITPNEIPMDVLTCILITPAKWFVWDITVSAKR